MSKYDTYRPQAFPRMPTPQEEEIVKLQTQRDRLLAACKDVLRQDHAIEALAFCALKAAMRDAESGI